MSHPLPSVIAFGTGTAAAMLLLILLVSELDRPVSFPTVSVPSTGVVGPGLNTTHALCDRACGTGARCVQSDASGQVLGCIACGTGLSMFGAACVAPPPCSAQGWCTTLLANATLLPVHNALITAALQYGNFTGQVPAQYPTDAGGLARVQASRNWTVLVQHGFTAAEAIADLNLYLARPGIAAVPWFDDQGGWWHTDGGWSAYRNALNATGLAPYVDQLKVKFCRTVYAWRIDTIAGRTCVAPL